MLKSVDLLKIERLAVEVLREVLAEADVAVLDVKTAAELKDASVDFVAHIDFHGQRHTVAVEVKSSGQPRHVQAGLFQLKQYVGQRVDGAIPIIVAPYLSDDARALCTDAKVGFLDLAGNARITFPGFFLSRTVAGKPPVEKRELRSLFKPKSVQVLKTMLREPKRMWRVVELAELADVSLGHVSNVRSSLLDRGWAEVSNQGVFLSNPDGLLDAWREEYQPPAGQPGAFYTTLHGSVLERAIRSLGDKPGHAVLASFSAANWLAPYGRTGTHYFYADEQGYEFLRSALDLSVTSRGENVAITMVEDEGFFRDTIEPVPGIYCTSPVQTYLDLFAAGERGRESADHLRREKLQWQT